MQMVMGAAMNTGLKRHLAVFFVIALLAGCGGGAANTTSSNAPLSLDSVQRQLAMLPCPPGVPTALWDSLTSEMLSQLQRRASASPMVAGPPLDELSIVDDLTTVEQPLGSVRLRWTYKNTGDYDQNRETNISDLTPIGLHFDKTAASADWGRASVADGDLNTEINISDVTPIGRCFLQTVTEYRIEYNATGAPGTEFAGLVSVPFYVGTEDANGRLGFNHTYAPGASGYYRVVPYCNEERGIEGQPVYFGANQPPIAVLNADPQAGRTPMVVSFDASNSSDPEHSALTFSWDWEGDGVYDVESGSVALQQHEYTKEGDYAPQLRVRDAKGLHSIAQLLVSTHNWQIHDIVPEASVSRAALVSGKPAFAYTWKESNEYVTLCYARSSVPVPKLAADWELMVVEASYWDDYKWVSTGQADPEVFELNERPAIFYWVGETRYAFCFAHATTAEPSGPEDWAVSSVFAEEPAIGMFSSNSSALDIDGRPYVFFSLTRSPEISLARGLVAEPSGSEDWDVTSVATWAEEDLASTYVSAALIAGKLCLAFRDAREVDLAFASCDTLTPTGPDDWQVNIIDSAGVCGADPDFQEINGTPAIVYISYNDARTSSEVRLASALTDTPEGPADWTLSTLASGKYFSDVELIQRDSGCIIIASDQRDDGSWQLLELVPPEPSLGDFVRPWVVSPINPDVEGFNSWFASSVLSGDWLVCLYRDTSVDAPYSYFSTKCAVANMPVRYSAE